MAHTCVVSDYLYWKLKLTRTACKSVQKSYSMREKKAQWGFDDQERQTNLHLSTKASNIASHRRVRAHCLVDDLILESCLRNSGWRLYTWCVDPWFKRAALSCRLTCANVLMHKDAGWMTPRPSSRWASYLCIPFIEACHLNRIKAKVHINECNSINSWLEALRTC